MGLRLITSAWRNLYAIDEDGLLRWYRYTGNGEANNAPGSVNWHPNSGNAIAGGWADFTAIYACVNGVIAGIHNDGRLYWHRYTGMGESDWTGTLGWDAASGTVIANGWGGFKHVVPFAGAVDTDIGLFAVTSAGDLRWYYFNQGWFPNSGNVIGSGWGHFARLTGAFTTIFAVDDHGDLRWYEYRGSGEFDPSGTVGWQPNSGNLIGNGWNGLEQLSCSVMESSGAVYELYGSDAEGRLRWYCYNGQGVPDPAGATGWHPNSRNVISGSW
jgi:hypothetical protein